MSRQTRRSWLMSAGLPRVLAETGLLVVVLTSLLLVAAGDTEGTQSRAILLGLGGFAVGTLAAPLGALRLRRVTGDRRQQVKGEIARAAAVVLVNAALSWAVIITGSALFPGSPVFAGIDPITCGASYGFWRGLLIGWPAWDRLRRSRLLWSLTHAQLVASLVIAVVVTLFVMAGALPQIESEISFPEELPGPAAAVAWVIISILATVSLLITLFLLISLVLILLVTVLSRPVLKRTTRRVEELASAAGALRAGDLTTRVPVAGEDEVARLQADFNAMAAELERTMQELAAERDTVAHVLQSQRELVAAVSHELRTPVATLRGYLESALEHWHEEPPPSLRADLAIMARETEQLQRLIDDLFTLSRVEAGQLPLRLEGVDVGTVLRRCADAAAGLAWERSRVEVLVEVTPDLPPAHADAARLEQIVRNLLANAVRHTPPGGLVLLGAERDGDAIVVQVSDTGEGIAPEDLPRIWERFYRGAGARDDARGGSGLGLALVKELTEAMGGSVAVESTPGQGSRFTVRLPLAHTPAPTRPATP